MRCIVGVELDVEHPDVLEQFRAQLDKEPRVQQSYYVTGESDFVLVVLSRDIDDYESLTQRLFFWQSICAQIHHKRRDEVA